MTKLKLRDCTFADLAFVARNLRKQDQEEVIAGGGSDPSGGFAIAMMYGETWALEGPSGNACMVGGVCPTEEDGWGMCWMMGTDEILDHTREFLGMSRPFINSLHEQYHTLTNTIHSKNTLHIRWVEWCGFTVDRDPIPSPAGNGEVFFNIVRTKSDV